MSEIALTPDGREALDRIMGVCAPILRDMRRQRIMRIASLLMLERSLKAADKATVIEAGRMVLSRAWEPFFSMIENPGRYREDAQLAWVDDQGYFSRRREVYRWPFAPAPPAKRPEEMKLLAFYTSPRPGGNTDVLMDEALHGARDAGVKSIEKFRVHKMHLQFCVGCRKCKEPGFTGYCVLKDAMADIYPKVIGADLLVFGFPIYTGRECAQMALLLDRWDCFEGFKLGNKHKLKPGRRAMVVGTWGYPRVDCYEHIIERIITTLFLHQIETVEALSACGFAGKYQGWDQAHKAIITHYPEETRKAYEAGKTLVTGVR